MIYTVEFVYDEEATPRDLNYRTVKAANAEGARKEVTVWGILNGDRVRTTGVLTDSWTTK